MIGDVATQYSGIVKQEYAQATKSEITPSRIRTLKTISKSQLQIELN